MLDKLNAEINTPLRLQSILACLPVQLWINPRRSGGCLRIRMSAQGADTG
jgi:hypothetical protein